MKENESQKNNSNKKNREIEGVRREREKKVTRKKLKKVTAK